MNCEWCQDEIEGALEYQGNIVNACDKDCAHGIKVVREIDEMLGITDVNMPTSEEQIEIQEELDNPYGFV